MTANITEAEYRNDGAAANALALLGNRMTGLGQRGRDKYLEHAIELNFTPLQRQELQALYRKSKICEKVVDLLPKAATANNWLEVTIGKGRKGIPAKAVQYSEDLKLRSAVREAGIMGRLDGDGFVLLGVDDGGKPWEPINEGRIRRISWVYPVDRWRLLPDNLSGRPGHPEYYSLYLPFTEALPDQQTNGKVHCSRVLRFPGKRLWGAMITENTGYNDSVLQTFFQSFVRYLIAIEYSTRMIQDYNVFTYKLQGLAQLILAGDEEKIFHRFQAILTSLSSLGGLAMDADKEDAQFISRNFGGLDVLIDRLKDDTSAAAAMPPTQLWGSSQKAALSNSSEGDKYSWADCIADYRSEILEEPISDFFRLVFLAQNGPTGGRLPESWGISYRSALRLNLKEQTELRATQTEKVDVPSIQAGILLKEEVRESAWAGSDYTIERQLQPALYTKQQAAAEEQQQPEPDEGSEAEADNQEEKPEADDASVNSLSDVFDAVDRADDLGVGDADSPFAQTGGTSRTDADANPITTIIDRADKHLSGLEDSAIERVNSALESAYQALEATILRGYSLETPGSLMARDRALVLLSQVADLLTLLNTRKADDIQQAFEDLLRGAEAQGVTLAQDLTRAIANQSLQMTANVPIEALQNQATEGMTRLRNHTNAFADKASTIVTQGLIQGWGTDKIASLLQRELGVVRHKAETIARTESLSASNAAIAATLAANDYTLFQFFATKDDRVCPFCSARNQNVYKLGESQPPLHPRCRCVMVGFKQEHLALGLIDTAWSQNFREGAIAELKAQGLEPNDGLAPFEKANGFEAPVAIWEPGQREDEWREDAGTPCGKGWIKAGRERGTP